MDTFHISQRIEKEITVDLNDYKNAFEQLSKNLPLFKAQLEKYDTIEELNALEPITLIPFKENFNLIKIQVTGDATILNACQKHGASLLPIEPADISFISELMKEHSIETLPVRVLIHKSIFSMTGKFLQHLTIAEITTLSGEYTVSTTVFNRSTKLFSHIPTPANPVDVLCQKINNPFDLPNSLQKLWLKTTDQIATSLPTIQKWSSLIKKFLYPSPAQAPPTTPVSDVQIPIPDPLSHITSFITKFSTGSVWSQMMPSDFSQFLKYCDNFKTLYTSFSNSLSRIDLSSFPVWNGNKQPGLRYPAALTLDFETTSLRKYLNLEQNFRLTGPVQIQPLSTGQAWNPGPTGTHIKVVAAFRIYDTAELAKLYQIKPIFHQNKMTSMKYLVSWKQQALTFSGLPALLKCTTNKDDMLSTSAKICHSFSQPGSSTTDTDKRISCAKVLLKEQGSFSDCLPMVTNDSIDSTIAVRADCSGYSSSVVVVSSTLRKIKVLVDCSASDQKAFEFQTFPTYLETPCPLFLVTKEGKKLLLPSFQPNYLEEQNRSLNFLVVTPPVPLQQDVDAATVAPPVTVAPEFTFTNFFSQPTYVSYFAVAVSIFTLSLISFTCFVLACRNMSMKQILFLCCCCTPENITSFLQKCICKCTCKDNKCGHCCRKRKPRQINNASDTDNDSEPESVQIKIEKPKKKTKKTKDNAKIKINALTGSELDELSNLMQTRFESRLPLKTNNKQNIYPSAPDSVNNSVNQSMASVTSARADVVSQQPSYNPSLSNLSVKSAPDSSNRKQKLIAHTFR
jgi:hypothetical protein